MSNPLVTYAMPCHRQADYVEEALRSAFDQTYQPLQIVIVDDASPDGSHDIIHRLARGYDGPHEVRVLRNKSRQGVETYNRLMKVARGALVVIGHCDDIALPHRVERIVEAWRRTGASVLSSNAVTIDHEGRGDKHFAHEDDADLDAAFIARNGWNSRMHGATLAWEPAVFDVFGGLSRERSALSTDWVLPFRGALLNGFHYIGEPLIKLRRHRSSRSYVLVRHGGGDQRSEAILANAIANWLYLLHTLKQVEASASLAPQPEGLEATIKVNLLTAIKNWTTCRNRLSAQGMRAIWTADPPTD